MEKNIIKNTRYCLNLSKGKKNLKINVTAQDSNHAQAQAADIARSLDVDTFSLSYEVIPPSAISDLYTRLAFSDFDHEICENWQGSFSNKSPCLYVFGKRFYVRTAILKYLDIPGEGAVPKPSCKNKHCINPYHFEYCAEKNTKLSGGDVQMLLAFQSQGASVQQIAKALNVHRSTIYRKLKDERLHFGVARHF